MLPVCFQAEFQSCNYNSTSMAVQCLNAGYQRNSIFLSIIDEVCKNKDLYSKPFRCLLWGFHICVMVRMKGIESKPPVLSVQVSA